MLELTDRAPVMLSTRHLTAGCFDEVRLFASSEGLLLVRPGCVLTIVAAATLLWQDPIEYSTLLAPALSVLFNYNPARLNR